MLNLEDSVTKVPLVGPRYAVILEYLGINTVEDLLYYFPTRFEDSSDVKTIADLNVIEKITIRAKLIELKSVRIRGGRSMQRGKIEDETAIIDVIWFNQPFLPNTLKIGSTYLFRGKLNPKSSFKPQLSSPEYEKINDLEFEDIAQDSEGVHLGRLTPIYSLTEGISSKWLRAKIKWVVDRIGESVEIKETLDQKIIEKYKLIDLISALKWIHFPKTEEEIEKAKDRLAFEEMLRIQIQLEKRRRLRKKLSAHTTKIKDSLFEKFVGALTFKPTGAQVRSIQEINKDLSEDKPMNRLLQGDVGSGKTLVAVEAALQVAKSGYQVAILVPTSVLAEQHYKNFSEMLSGFDISVELVTGNTVTGSEDGSMLPKADILIGTHAILHRKQDLLERLGLLVIDEQHRFGVEQRRELMKDIDNLAKGKSPHVLTMTATPIPRSMVLALFGDLDVSVIDEMPAGRIPTQTYLVPDGKRADSYKWIKEKVKEGVKVFWITPLIEESDKLETKSAEETFKLLKKIYPDLKIEILHGRIKAEEKQNILKKFEDGEFQILVSTSVIEVGIDIPDADIIVIEGAERFGLAQLHQLRGRVGRRKNESYCFLFTSKGEETVDQSSRLKFFAKENDGLKIAEFDLQRRGPGEVYGTKQAGIPDLKIANFMDLKLIERTREAAETLV